MASSSQSYKPKSKFKPAPLLADNQPTASASTSKWQSTSRPPLQSFSTANFGKPKPAPTHDVIDILDDEEPWTSVSVAPLKRPSREPSENDVDISSKRIKQSHTQSRSGPDMKLRVNGTATVKPSSPAISSPPLQSSHSLPHTEEDSGRPRSMNGDPTHISSDNIEGAAFHTASRAAQGLDKLSSQRLKQLLIVISREKRRVDDEISDYYIRDEEHDIEFLNLQREYLQKRTDEVLGHLEHHKNRGSHYTHQPPQQTISTTQKDPRVEHPPPVTSAVMSSYSTERTKFNSPFSPRSHNPVSTLSSSVNHQYTNKPAPPAFPDSDDILWETQDVIVLDDDFETQDLDLNPKSVTTVSPAASTTVVPTQAPAVVPTSPYDAEIMRVLKDVFNMSSFRPYQLEAIQATLSGKDVFVLMPTGGGKSLCFQLPALCRGGATCGVTFVVSPLIALMQDQVQALKRRGADVVLWNSEVTGDESNNIRSRLYGRDKPNLVYVTPEKLQESNVLKSVLVHLHREQQLARFVIDEAHCISGWGRSFREAYTSLGSLRREYPGIPIMALTGTANSKVVHDIKANLNIPGCVFLEQSHNRVNLRYIVQQKTKEVASDIAKWIQQYHPRDCGVIYCFSRNDCETFASNLRENHNIRAEHYHAGMSSEDRSATLKAWMIGRFKIIVATIAFGMGIDKPDVRFVIHHSLPKNLEGYYQETGRAGRDGLPADCLLYFSVGDVIRLCGMLARVDDQNRKPSDEELARQKEDVFRVQEYCSNNSDCRRVQILRYFDEMFDPKNCHGLCDNCATPGITKIDDRTQDARNMIRLIQYLKTISRDMFINIFIGKNLKAIRDKGHDSAPLFGVGKHLDKTVASRIFDMLLSENAVTLFQEANTSGFHNTYYKAGPKARAFMQRKDKFMVSSKIPIMNKPGSTRMGPESHEASTSTASDKPSRKNKTPASPRPEMGDPISFFPDDDVLPTVLESLAKAPEADETSAKVRYEKLMAFRDREAKKKCIDPDEIFTHEMVQTLSLLAPTDQREFKRIFDEDNDFTTTRERWSAYGSAVINICSRSNQNNSPKRTRSSTASTIPQPAELRSKYSFQASSSTTAATNTMVPRPASTNATAALASTSTTATTSSTTNNVPTVWRPPIITRDPPKPAPKRGFKPSAPLIQ